MAPLRIAVLVKQIPAFEEMELGPDGRLQREGLDLEMNPYCRRAVSKGVELAGATGGAVTVLTLGPPPAEDTLREALAWADERGVAAEGILVTDPAFAGSDTLATARALAAALAHTGPFDLVLAGRNSVDADTGQVGPEVAELLDLPFVTGVRELELRDHTLAVRCEHDDGWVRAELPLPAVISTAERLCEPCKVDPDGRAAVPAERIRRVRAADLGPGPWGQEGSPTWVGPVRVHETERVRHLRPDAPLDEQVRDAVDVLLERGALDPALDHAGDAGCVPAAPGAVDGPSVAVLVEPGRDHLARELLGSAATLAADLGGRVVALTIESDAPPAAELGRAGADAVVALDGAQVEEDVAAGAASWSSEHTPWAVLAPSTAWGREVAARAAARIGAGLTGDAVALEVDDGRLVAWKPAFGGQLVAAISASSPVQMATVRAGVLPLLAPRPDGAPPPTEMRTVTPRGRVSVVDRTRDDDIDTLAEATVVVGLGTGVPPDEYGALQPLLDLLGAELGATRKVTDKGWLPRARQVGITGRSIAPRLYVALGVHGKFNHMVGVRAAKTVLAVNTAPNALVFDAADVGIVGDWRDVVPLLTARVGEVVPAPAAG
jgi:electron transfer flavoprotein alpha subunit